ncbi:hypothetical protein SLEP1_g6722 [Rubroshorea leprosula]|uniref:Protein TPX2 n=1 Tax=Rubroshorea leprosula TaxID=152421 RepID=A0AAV5I481_9ROSI|nr:hypothetical protein SLEP1_g6722 [Rubroshorea leprosula]
MAVAADESSRSSIITMIDEVYEFSAPRFFDFIKGESEEEARRAELWFESALSYAPSPFMARIKKGRSFKVETLCDFSEAVDQMQKETSESDSAATHYNSEDKPQIELMPEIKEEKVTATEAREDNNEEQLNQICKANGEEQEGKAVCNEVHSDSVPAEGASLVQVGNEVCTPKPLLNCKKELEIDKKHHQIGKSAKKIGDLARNPSALRPKNQLQSSKANSTTKLASEKRETNVKNMTGAPSFAQENQAIKRQKLEGGRSRQILNPKPVNLAHKSKLGLASGTCSSAKTSNKLERKVYVREQAEPFVSMAEMMKRFQSSTRDLSLAHANSSVSFGKPKLTLTRPKEPEFETAQRVRSVRIKSTAELEEEMIAKIPKFKARQLNKKILEAPTLPALQRSTPKPPEFQEFHLATMARASQNAETSSIASTAVSRHNNQWKPHLTEPQTPLLQTSSRARPPKVKSSIELEQEELEKAPKFKARPLNKKIFESKGELGISCHEKKQVTIPQEFHFATNERIPPPAAVVDLFDKLSLKSERRHDPITKSTIPNPFHLHTEERGTEKERRFVMELMQKQLEEEKARVPKANPYPYTTDFPVIPPKPEPKPCTRPEPFQLESLVRHEEEMQREMEERWRKEKEEAQMRLFKAQLILKKDPIPVPDKVRKPLTQVQEVKLHVDHRAVDRAEFDQRIKEKEMMYKRYREESEAARMIEEEKALKQLRRTMVPHARPVPKFENPFCPQKSAKETTRLKSPNLRVLRRKEQRKMVGSLTATSSPATLMR